MMSTREPSGRAGASTTSQSGRQATNTASHLPPPLPLDFSEEVNDFATILARGLMTPTSVMRKWLGGLPDPKELGPNEHFAVGEYDDENGHRKSAMFVCKRVGPQPPDDYPDWTHPRKPPMPPTVPKGTFNPHDFLNHTPVHAQHEEASGDHHTFFKATALTSVATGKNVLKRFAKKTGRVLEHIAVMPDYGNPNTSTSRPPGLTISQPFQKNGKETAFSTITLVEARAREQARKTNFKQRQAVSISTKPLERRQIGNPSRQTLWEDFQTYQSPPPNSQEVEENSPLLPLSLPRIPKQINCPSRKPFQSRTPASNLEKPLPSSPSMDSLRRRTQMPPAAGRFVQPEILAVPAMRGVMQRAHRNAAVSQCGLVFGDAEAPDPDDDEHEKTSWPGTPASFTSETKVRKPMWWQFEGSGEELDPTQADWARMEDSLRNDRGIRKVSGSADRGERF